MSRYPNHIAYTTLLEQKQFVACRIACRAWISQLTAVDQPNDHEISCLHLLIGRAFMAEQDYSTAAEEFDIAVYLARRVNDVALLEEALYRGGVAYSRARSYRTAVKRLTDAIECGGEKYRGEALYARAFTYETMGADEFAIPDYEAALLGAKDEPQLARRCRINLAWALILQRNFKRAEEVLGQLTVGPDAADDAALQFQVAHDRLHISYLKGDGREALTKGLALLKDAKDYPHVRAHVALTMMSYAGDRGQHGYAFILGVFAKRLGGQARRLDIDEEASRKMRQLEYQAGTECLIESLQQVRQVLPGSVTRRKATRGGGVG